MKALVLSLASGALLATTSAAMAEITIKGKNTQEVRVTGAVANVAVGAGASAKQSLASNVGKVKIGGDNKQTVDVKGAVANVAVGAMTKAEQSLASNVGD